MNKLELAQMVNTLAGTQGEVDNAETATGYQSVLVLMVDKAYKDIQTYRKYWNFMRTTTEVLLTEAIPTITNTEIREVLAIRYNFGRLKQDDYDRVYLLTDQSLLPEVYPQVFYVNPFTKVIYFNPMDAEYRVDVDYWRTPHRMTANGMSPILPEEHHYAIVYKALMNLGSYLGNDDLINEYQLHYDYEMGELMRSQLPQEYITTVPFA